MIGARLRKARTEASRTEAMLSDFTRRSLIAGASLAATSALPAQAAAPPAGRQAPSVYRYRVGSLEITALYDGVWYRPIDEKFVRHADYAEVRREMSDEPLAKGIYISF